MRKMDEMEMLIALKSARIAWIYTVVFLFIWVVIDFLTANLFGWAFFGQERFNSEVVEDDAYFLTVLRYIHQNPIKAGMTKDLLSFKWSSIHEYVKEPVIIDTFFALNMFSADREKAVSLFNKFMEQQNNDRCLDVGEKVRISDDEVRAVLSRQSGADINQLLKLEKQKRDEIIRSLKSIEGVTVRQLSRITGISKSVIDRI